MKNCLLVLLLLISVPAKGDGYLPKSPGGEVGGNGEDLSSWITSIGYEVLGEIERNPVEDITPDEFRDALVSTKLIFVTEKNKEELEKLFRTKILVNPFHGPIGPKVQVKKHIDEEGVEKYFMFLDYHQLIGSDGKEIDYRALKKDYRSVSHGYVMASGKKDSAYEITAKRDFSALLDSLESNGLKNTSQIVVEKNVQPKRESPLTREGGAITLAELNNINVKCLVGDLENNGIIPVLFRATLQKEFPKYTHIPSWKLSLKNERLDNLRPRWRVSLYTYTQLPVGVPYGTIYPGSKYPIYYEAIFTLGGRNQQLSFWPVNLNPRSISLWSAGEFPHVRYRDADYVYDDLGYLLEDKSLVDQLYIANEEGPEDMGFLNGGGPTKFKVSLLKYKECLRKALEKVASN